MNEYPVARSIEAVPFEAEGRKMVSLSDPQGFSDVSLAVSLPAFFIITQMNGHRNVSQIRDEFYKQFNQPVLNEDILSLISKLDDNLFLDNARFKERKATVRESFLADKTRRAVFAGKSYPDDEKQLNGLIDKWLAERSPKNGNFVKAIIVPHIDFRAGGDMMAAGWREIRNSDADLFVILGVGHSLSDDFFACVDKDFSTPLGVMKVDSDFLASLRVNFGEEIYGQADAHRNEHSIEFQSLFMSHMARLRPGISAAPILLSFPENIWSISHPVFNGERIDRFIEALKKTAQDDGREICFVASVDFSHVGARFGDPFKLTADKLKQIENDDRELIDAILSLDTGRFMAKILQTNSRNRVCGFPALYTLLKVIKAGRGELIEYRQNLEGEGETMVSFASLILCE